MCVLIIVKLDVIGYWWLVFFVLFYFDIKYRVGSYNVDVDVFSCLLINIEIV